MVALILDSSEGGGIDGNRKTPVKKTLLSILWFLVDWGNIKFLGSPKASLCPTCQPHYHGS